MSKDDATWLNVGYLCFGVLIAFFSYKALELTGIQTGWSEVYGWWRYVSLAAAIAIGAGLTWWLRADSERHDYLLASIGELRKVTWPTWPDTKRMTVIVVIVVSIFAVIVSIFDLVWTRALRLLLA